MRIDCIRMADAGTLLIRALRRSAEAADCPVAIDRPSDRPWASHTFAGTRHMVHLSAPATPALDAWLRDLPEAELPMRGHVVADCAVEARAVEAERLRVALSVLTIEEG